jgi:hypothetical protein
MSWQAAYLAMSVALGVSVDDAVSAVAPLRDEAARELEALLRSTSRARRARALAAALGHIARDVSALDLSRGGVTW